MPHDGCICLPFLRRRRPASGAQRSWELKKSNNTQSKFGTGNFGLPNFDPSDLVNRDGYEASRIIEIDEDEKLNWTNKAVQMLYTEDPSFDVGAQLRTAIRKGVPDYLKPEVFMQAQRANEFFKMRPHYYEETLKSTFGTRVPTFFETRVPTFSGGFLGVEEEISGSPLDVRLLEEELSGDVSHSAVSWTDLGSLSSSQTPRSKSHSFSLPFPIKTSPPSLLPLESHDFGNMGLNYRSYVDHAPIMTPLKPERKDDIDRYSPVELNGDILTPRLFSVTEEAKSFRNMRSKSLDGRYDALSQSQVSIDVLPSYSTGHMGQRRRESVKDVYKLESVTHLHHLLSDKGLVAAKRILWCISGSFEDLEFCPILPSLICVLLLYVSEEFAFIIVHSLLTTARLSSKSGNASLFMTYRRTEYVRFVKLVVAAANKHLGKAVARMTELGFDVAAWIAKTMATGLAATVPFNMLLRIYTNFLFEGAKVLQRYCLGLLKVNEDRIARCTSRIEVETLLHGSQHGSLKELNQLTKDAFKFNFHLSDDNIHQFSSHDLPTPYLTGVKLQRFYRPRLSESSTIIKDSEWEYVWAWIPSKSRILDPFLAWRSDKDGSSLLALDRLVSPYYERPMVYLLHTKTGEVVGGYSPRAFSLQRAQMTKVDPSDSLIFQLRPNKTAHFWSGANRMFIDLRDFILIGGNDVALSVDAAIHRGHAAPSESFDSPKLAGDDHGDFVICSMEVWILE